MTDFSIPDDTNASVEGKYAVVTGGASGIGLACCKLLAARGAAAVFMLDLNPPEDPQCLSAGVISYLKCDVANWDMMQDVFATFPRVDYVFANAGRGQGGPPTQLQIDIRSGRLLPPNTDVVNVNYRGALYTAVLGIRAMRGQGSGGSIVFTGSATGFSYERGLPLYGSLQLAIVGLVRGWRTQLIHEGITVNAVAPAATISGLMSEEAARKQEARGLQISTAHHVAKALVFSATAREQRRVEAYGTESEADNEREGPWNGRVIMTMGERYTEVEEPLERLKSQWFGGLNLKHTRIGQVITDGMFPWG